MNTTTIEAETTSMGDDVPAVSSPERAFRVECFLDRENIKHSAQRLGCSHPDYARLVHAAARKLACRLDVRFVGGVRREDSGGAQPAEPDSCTLCCKTWCVVGKPVNVHQEDRKRLQGWGKWLASFQQRYGFVVMWVPLDFHGFHMRAEDRRHSQSEAEREWQPAEKGVDNALSLHMVRRAEAPDRPDGMILLAGDADYGPAVQRVREVRPQVHIAIASFAGSLSHVFYKRNPVDYEWDMEPIVLDPYLTAAPGKGNVRVASLEVVCEAGEVQTVEGSTMVTVATGGAGASGIGAQRGIARMRPPDDLEVGRIAVNRPRRGELNVYRKRDGATGSTVLCEEDGGKYGVALGVLKRFPEIGTYVGWAYVDVQRGVAFRFVVGEAAAEPDSLLAIDTSDGRVEVPPSSTAGVRFEHNALVAFYWRFASRNGDGKPRRQATRVYGLDRAHLPLIARLIANGRLVFPEHAEVLDTFFGGVTNADVRAQDAARFREALDRLAADPGVPSGFQVMARVERARLVSGGPETPGLTAPQGPPAVTPEGKAKGKSRRAGKPGGYNPAVGDVSSLDLQVG